VKVLDFGIAKILEVDTPSSGDGPPSAASVLTGVGTVVGTPAYMSPEQCRGERIDTRSDIYACGILLYQLVCGRLPFASQNAMDLAVMHVRAPPVPPEQIVPGVNQQLSAIILQALSKWPSQRQQSAAELRDALRALEGQLSPFPLDLAPAASPAPAGGDAHPADAPPPPGTALAPSHSPNPARSLDPNNPDAWLLGDGGPARPSSAPPTQRPGAPLAGAPSPQNASLDEPPVLPSDGALRPRPVPNPVAGPLRLRGAVGSSAQEGGLRSWLIVPVALLLGIAMGALAFLLSRR
jgi:serine/threonine-protein kinase